MFRMTSKLKTNGWMRLRWRLVTMSRGAWFKVGGRCRRDWVKSYLKVNTQIETSQMGQFPSFPPPFFAKTLMQVWYFLDGQATLVSVQTMTSSWLG